MLLLAWGGRLSGPGVSGGRRGWRVCSRGASRCIVRAVLAGARVRVPVVLSPRRRRLVGEHGLLGGLAGRGRGLLAGRRERGLCRVVRVTVARGQIMVVEVLVGWVLVRVLRHHHHSVRAQAGGQVGVGRGTPRATATIALRLELPAHAEVKVVVVHPAANKQGVTNHSHLYSIIHNWFASSHNSNVAFIMRSMT
jgi:hypothetical protein